MSPTPEVDGGHHPAQGMGTPRKSSPKTTPTLIGGCRRTSPNKSARKTPIRSNKSKMVTRSSQSSPKPDKLVNDVVGGNGRRDEPSVKKPDSFQDHKELCDRVAKSLYFANKLPTTPRPSLPLTSESYFCSWICYILVIQAFQLINLHNFQSWQFQPLPLRRDRIRLNFWIWNKLPKLGETLAYHQLL